MDTKHGYKTRVKNMDKRTCCCYWGRSWMETAVCRSLQWPATHSASATTIFLMHIETFVTKFSRPMPMHNATLLLSALVVGSHTCVSIAPRPCIPSCIPSCIPLQFTKYWFNANHNPLFHFTITVQHTSQQNSRLRSNKACKGEQGPRTHWFT